MKKGLKFFSLLFTCALTAYSALHIFRSELGVGMVHLTPLFYVSFIALLCLMGVFLISTKNNRIPSIAYIVLTISIYWTIKTALSTQPTGYNILSVEYSYIWFLTIVFSYNYFLKLGTNENRIINYLFICFIITSAANILSYLTLRSAGVSIMPLVYNSVIFLPWILVNDNKKYIIAGFTILSILIILSAKRGAVVILAVQSLLLGYHLLKNRKVSFGTKAIIFIVAPLFIYGVYNKVSSQTDSFLAEKFSAEELADGSGRAEINEYGFNEISKMYSFKEYFFGYDLGSSNLLQFGGHNDWLTYMLHYGLIGVFLYFLLYVYIIIGIFKLKRIGTNVYLAYFSLFIIMVVLSLISSSYNPVTHPLIGMLFIGFAEAKIKQSRMRV